jgi:hypothetical protein
MVRTVNIRVTIQTGITHDLVVVRTDRCLIIGGRGMARRDMTALAEERQPRHEHMLVMRAMRIMAIQTIFAHRRMLIKERSALIRVTGVASLIGGISIEHLRRRGPVWIVTGGAVHLAFFDGHVGIPIHLGHNILMALGADLRNLGLHEEELVVLRGMHTMTGQAGDIPFFVNAAHPMDTVFILMALEAGLFELDGGEAFKIFDRGEPGIGTVPGRGRMQRTRSVTGFAGFFKWNVLALNEGMPVHTILKIFSIFVAAKTGLRPDVFGTTDGCRSGCGHGGRSGGGGRSGTGSWSGGCC